MASETIPGHCNERPSAYVQVEAGERPRGFDLGLAKRALKRPAYVSTAFLWVWTAQGRDFWIAYRDGLATPEHAENARAILRQWIADAEASS